MAQAPDFVVAQHWPKSTSRNTGPYQSYVLLALIVLVGLLLLAALFVATSMYASDHANTANATIESNLVPVAAVIPGQVKEVLVRENQTVKKGQILARLDNRELNLHEREAVVGAELARQKSDSIQKEMAQIISAAHKRSAQMAENLAQMQAVVDAAPAELAKLKKEEAKAGVEKVAALKKFDQANAQYEQLVGQANQGLVDPGVVQNAGYLVEQARAKVEDANINVNAAQAGAQRVQQIVMQMKAGKIAVKREHDRSTLKEAAAAKYHMAASLTALKEAELVLERARLASSNAIIMSPIDGIVSQKMVRPGQRVQPGQPLVAVVELEMWVVANFDEKQAARIEPKQRVAIRLAISPDRILSGHVKSVAPVAVVQAVPLPQPTTPGPAASAKASSVGSPSEGPVQNVLQAHDSQPEWSALTQRPIPMPPAASAETVTAPKSDSALQQPLNSVRTVPVKIEFDTESLKAAGLPVHPGMSASVSIYLR